MAGKGEGGLKDGDWVNTDDTQDVPVNPNIEFVENEVDFQKPTTAVKTPQMVWQQPVSVAAPEEVKKAEPYRPGAHSTKKKMDGFFPALGTAPAAAQEPAKEPVPEINKNPYASLATDDPADAKPATQQQPEGSGKKSKKKDKWKTIEAKVVVGITDAEKNLTLAEDAKKMYELKATKNSYAPRPERRSEFSGESDTTWRTAGETRTDTQAVTFGRIGVRKDEPGKRTDEPQAVRKDEPFRRAEDAPPRRDEPIRRAEDPVRRDEGIHREGLFTRADEPSNAPAVWRTPAQSSPSTGETERKEGPVRKFVNSKKKADPETGEEAREDEWHAADQQAREKPKVNMWAQRDPQI